MVFLFLLRQAMRQPVAVFAYKHVNFQGIGKNYNALRVAIARLSHVLQLSRHRHRSLLCPAISFTHSGYITFQSFAALNYLTFHFASIRFSLLQSTGCNIRLACSSPPAAWLSCLLQKRKKQKSRQPLAASSSHPLHYRAPSLPPVAQLATARTAQCPQTTTLHSAICSHFGRRLLRAV